MMITSVLELNMSLSGKYLVEQDGDLFSKLRAGKTHSACVNAWVKLEGNKPIDWQNTFFMYSTKDRKNATSFALEPCP